jgi:hypothetical protein
MDIRKNPDVILDLRPNWTWALPQVSAWFGNSLPLAKNKEGLISPSMTMEVLKEELEKGAIVLGSTVISMTTWKELWNQLITSPRGDLLQGGTQTRTPAVRWNAGVPLILSFFKEHRGLGYDSWDWTDPMMAHWMDPDLYKALTTTYPQWSLSELVVFRDQGLVIKSGMKTGTTRDPRTAPNLTGVDDPHFNRLPRLLKLLLCQCWCYHPNHRHHLMVTSTSQKDQMPPPLVQDQVVAGDVTTTSPWS